MAGDEDVEVGDVAIYESGRRFEVSRWGVGHDGLLLRSIPSPEHSTRIEVVFKPAHVVCLPAFLSRLRIDAVETGPALTSVEALLRRSLETWEHLYTVTSREMHGWVVGGTVAGREDDEEDDAPTMFDGWAPRDGVRTLFELRRE